MASKEVKLTSYEAPYREAYAIFESFRRLGYPADDIFVGFGHVVGFGPDQLFVQLRSDDLLFVAVAGKVAGNRANVLDKWTRFATAVNAAPQHEVRKLWKGTSLGRDEAQFGQLVTALLSKGFTPPALQN